MKKSLAVICAVAILLSSLAGTFMFASANVTGATTVELPTLSGNLTVGEAAGEPAYSSTNLPLTVVENTSNLPLANLFQYTGVAGSGWTKGTLNWTGNSNAVGMMFYVETPASSHLNPYLNFYAQDGKKYLFTAASTGSWYLLGETDTEWKAYNCAPQNCGINIPAGFKGYMYIPYTKETLSYNAGRTYTVTSSNPLTSMTLEITKSANTNYGYVPAGETFVFSAPMWVTSGAAEDMPSVEKVSISGNEVRYFKAPEVHLDGTEVVFPTYNGVTLVGGEASVPTTVVSGGAVNSVKNTADLPFTNLFEITNEHQTASTYRDIKITPTAGKGAIIYVNAPSIDDILRLGVYVIHENGTAYRYGNDSIYDWFALEEGDTEWKVADVINYGVDVSGFKGYIYIPFVRLDQNAGGVVTTGSKVTAIRVYNEIGTIPAGKSLKISAPIIVKGDVDANISAPVLPDAKQVNDGTNVYNYYVEKKTQFGANEVLIVNPSKFDGELVAGQNAPTTVVAAPATGVAHAVVANVGGVTGLPDVKISKTVAGEKAAVSFNKMDKAASRGAVGFMNYFKLSDEARRFKLTVKAYDAAGADIDAFIYRGKAWTLADGETVWTELAINTYYFELPANFSGYVKFSYADSTFAAGNGDFADIDYLSNVNYLTDDVISAEKAVTIGMPVHIYQDADTNICMIGKALNASTGETAGQITGPGTTSSEEASSEESSSAESSSEESSSAESSSEESSSDVSSTPSEPTQPDYKVDPYTGTAIDYSGLNIQNVTVGKLNGVVTVGGTVPTGAANPAKDTSIAAVASKIGITKYPTFKLNSTSVSFTLDRIVAPKNPAEVMYYIELPAGKGATTQVTWNFYNAENLAYYNIMYSGTAYLLAEGDTSWSSTPVAAYNFELPAGFKGYVKFDVTKIHSQDNSPAGNKATFVADTEKFLNNTAIKFVAGIDATDDVYMSAPIFVTKTGTVANVAFVDGETNAARNLFTGAVVTRAELGGDNTSSDDTSSDNTSSGGNTPSNPDDYKVPAYTGEAIDYSGLNIQSVTVGKLNGVVTVGADVPANAASPAKDTSIAAVASKIGITKYPSFKLNSTSVNFNLDKAVAPKNPAEVMYYIELPAGKSATIQTTWNFYNAEGLAYYNTIYSGTAYFLANGSKLWESTAISAYNFQLPAGFKGYVKFDVSKINSQLNSPAGDKATFVADTEKYLNNTTVKFVTGIDATDDVYLSAPIFVTRASTENGHVAFVDGETNAARNLFSGEVATRAELDVNDTSSDNTSSDDTSSDSTSSDDASSDVSGTDTPDYKLPAYTGPAINYDKIDIMSVTVGKLNGVVTVDNPVSKDAVNPGKTGLVGAVASKIGITKYPSFKLNSTSVNFNLDKAVAPKNPAEVMYYIELPAGKSATIQTTWNFYNAEGLAYYNTIYNGTAYLLAEGKSEWTGTEVSAYNFVLPEGFKGYVKFLVKDINSQSNSPAGDKATFLADKDKYLNNTSIIFSEGIEATDDVYVSTALFVTNTGVVPNVAFVDGETNAARNLFTGNVVKRDALKDYLGQDDGSDTPSDPSNPSDPSTPADPNAPKQPDYKVQYNGAAIDYTDIDIMKVIVGKLKGVVKIGGDLTDVGASTAQKGTIEAIESANKLTNYPSFKINAQTSKAPLDGLAPAVANFTLDKSVSPKNPHELMYYVEVPSDKDMKATVTWNFYSENGLAYYNTMYNGTCSILKDGETEWKELKISLYKFTLPAGFKGYIKFKTDAIGVQSNSPAYVYAVDEGLTDLDVKQYFKADTTKYLATTAFCLSECSEDMDVIVSAPLYVVDTGAVPNVAFVDGETKAAYNIFTGAVATRDSLKDYIGISGEEILEPGEVPAINYNIPKYTGTKYEYGNYEFARVRQFVLAKNIAKGYVISPNSFTDGHPDGTNAYTKLVDSTIGLSKMPLFSITKSTGQPNNTEGKPVSLGTWHPNPKVETNAGPGAIMQYLKLPANLEKPFVQLTMNFFDKDNMVKNVAPYNGVIFYMDKNSNEWVSTKITAYWFELPKGFDGYILLETKSLKAQNGGDFAADWQMYNYNVNIGNLDNMTVVASAPFWVDKKGDIDYACYLNDEQNAVRNIFTGKILKKEDVIKPLKIGDTIVKLPDYTTDFSASIADKNALSSGTAVVEWDSIDNAVKYVVRVFKKVNTDDGIAYNFVAEAEATDTKVTINDLELNTQYAIVVYAYDAKDNEIAVFDYINASTAGGAGGNAPVTKPTTPSTPSAPEESGFNWLLIALIIGGVVVLAGIAVAVIIIIKKRKANVTVGDEVLTDAEINADVNTDIETPSDTDA